MTDRERFVGIVTDGVAQIHAIGDGLYASLCGLDGTTAGQSLVAVPNKPKIDCPQCIALWRAWRRYEHTDFAPQVRR